MRHNRFMPTYLLQAVIFMSCLVGNLQPGYAQDGAVFILKASDWNVPRTTQTILGMPAVRQTVRAYNKNPKAKIQIRYPGGDEGTLWAAELRSWLVALGIASEHIELLPGSRDAGSLELQVMPPAVFEQPVK